MKKTWLFGIIILSILFIIIAVLFKIYEVDVLPVQFYGALIGVVITAIITVFLLQGQTNNEEKREKSVKIFEKKQEIYHSFLKEIESIFIDLTEKGIKGNDKTAYENITKLESLIFQFSYLHIHMREDVFLEVISNLSEVFKTYNEIQLYKTYKAEISEQNKHRSDVVNKSLLLLMQKITEHLFYISKLLNKDLYGIKENEKNEQILKEMDGLFYNCGLGKFAKQDTASNS